MRAQIEKKVAQKEKEKKEENLRLLAQKAREDRAGIRRGEGKDEGFKERDELRRDRQKERQRDRNLSRAAPDKRSGGKLAGVKFIQEVLPLANVAYDIRK